MKEMFSKIWKLALPYQDKRDDRGHGRIVKNFAVRLLENERGDENILIPTAILHDIGWSQLSKEERFYIFKHKITKEVERKMRTKLDVRTKHESEGAKLAKKILEEINYNKNKTKIIVKIISQHDTGRGPFSKEEALLHDADKLWTYSRLGFIADIKRFKLTPRKCYDMAKKRINMSDYFNTESAKKLANAELKKRKIDFKI